MMAERYLHVLISLVAVVTQGHSHDCYSQTDCAGEIESYTISMAECCATHGQSISVKGKCRNISCGDSDASTSYKGTDFIVGFAGNLISCSILIETSEKGIVHVNVTTSFSGTSLHKINSTHPQHLYFDCNNVILTQLHDNKDRAIKVKSMNKRKISVLVLSGISLIEFSSEYYAYPCDSIKVNLNVYKYIDSRSSYNDLLIMTCEDDTTVNFTPSNIVDGGDSFVHESFGPGTSQMSSSLTLDGSTLIPASKTFLISISSDSIIKSNYPLVIILVTRCEYREGCEVGSGQLLPHTAWGTMFLFSDAFGSSYINYGTFYDNTEVTFTCVNEGDINPTVLCSQLTNSTSFIRYNRFASDYDYCSIESSNPISLVNQITYFDYSYPLQFIYTQPIPPVSQYLSGYHSVPPTNRGERQLFVLIFTSFLPTVYLNGYLIEYAIWQSLYCGTSTCGYVLKISIDDSAHMIYSDSKLVYNYLYEEGRLRVIGGTALTAISGPIVRCSVSEQCLEESDVPILTCTKSFDLLEESRIMISVDDIADSVTLFPSINGNASSKNVLIFGGRNTTHISESFDVQLGLQHNETSSNYSFFVTISPVINAIVLTPQLQVNIVRCKKCIWPNSSYIDVDQDCIADIKDNCVEVFNRDQTDTDGDGVGDQCDNCVFTPNTDQKNDDDDLVGSACDANDSDSSVAAMLKITGEGTDICVEVVSPLSTDCPIEISFHIYISTENYCTGVMFDQCKKKVCSLYIRQSRGSVDHPWQLLLRSQLGSKAQSYGIIVINQNANAIIKDDDIVVIKLEIATNTAEEGGIISICAVITQAYKVLCPVSFAFDLLLNLNTLISNEIWQWRYGDISPIISMKRCKTRGCSIIDVIEDDIAVNSYVLEVSLKQNTSLIDNIILDNSTGRVVIRDNDDMRVGFTSAMFTGAERVGYINVCVEVQNTLSFGAVIPFNITLYLTNGYVKTDQYIQEHSVELSFEVGTSQVCHKYIINDDGYCEVKENTTKLKLNLTLEHTNLPVITSEEHSSATVIIDDNGEEECYIRVGYEKESYTLLEKQRNVEVCISAYSPGIDEVFVINSTLDYNMLPDDLLSLIKNGVDSLSFSVNGNHRTQRKCCNISAEFVSDYRTCQYFNCSNLIMDITMVKNANFRIHFTRAVSTFIIEQPRDCDICSLTNNFGSSSVSSTTIIMATLVPFIFLVVVISVIVLLFFQKYSKNKKLSNGLLGGESISYCETNYILMDEDVRSLFSGQLKQRLKDKRMIFSKSQLQISTAVGQGESGLVFKGYITTSLGKELVAIKTGKALFTTTDIRSLVKEISAMLSFDHINVMSLRGVCIEGDMPLLIMPFMSNGSVLEFVKNHTEELLLTKYVEIKIISARKSLIKICHQISKGMEYLSQENFVHRDLAARNCMIDGKGVIKVADFGLTETMRGTNYYRRRKSVGSKEKVPIRWMSPESIEGDIYNEATDVWSFGVTMWEVFACGRVPYSGIQAMSLLRHLQNGERLGRPYNKACGADEYTMMFDCWEIDPINRPSFTVLVNRLTEVLEKEAGYLALCGNITQKETNADTSVPIATAPGSIDQRNLPDGEN